MGATAMSDRDCDYDHDHCGSLMAEAGMTTTSRPPKHGEWVHRSTTGSPEVGWSDAASGSQGSMLGAQSTDDCNGTVAGRRGSRLVEAEWIEGVTWDGAS